MRNQYKDHRDFFEKCGDQWLHPREYGECIYPVTVEEMYQYFKSRMLAELCESPELMFHDRYGCADVIRKLKR